MQSIPATLLSILEAHYLHLLAFLDEVLIPSVSRGYVVCQLYLNLHEVHQGGKQGTLAHLITFHSQAKSISEEIITWGAYCPNILIRSTG